MRTYEDGLKYLLGLTGRGIRPGLERVRRALRACGNPERRVRSVVVGGTNGKGSVSALLAQAAREEGLRVGLYTSPHLHRLTERIRLDGEEIGRQRLVSTLERVAALSAEPGGPQLTFFETLTVVAALVFAEDEVDLAVVEVGLGGRLDATKVFPASVVAITSISMDHQQYLGDTLEAIGSEKFALTRRGAIVVAGALEERLLPLLKERAALTRSPLWLARRDYSWRARADGLLDYEGPFGRLEGLPQPLRGAHQAHNTAVAVSSLAALGRRGVPVSEGALRRALQHLSWPGRYEVCEGGRLVFDVAHNPAGAEALRDTLREQSDGRRPIVFVFGCMRDKDVEGIARPLREVADEVFIAAPRMPRALEPESFPPWLGGRTFDSVEAAADAAVEAAGERGLVVVTGSTFVVSEARRHLLRLGEVDPSVPM